MTITQLWAFLLAHGVKFSEALGLGLGLLFLVGASWMALNGRRQQRWQRKGSDVGFPLLGLGCGLASLYSSYIEIRERSLMEVSGGHYTVCTVISHDSLRGLPRFTCVYYVAGQRYQTAVPCGVVHGQQVPCAALAERRFVVFAPEDPGTARILDVRVPDTLRHVPAQGWPHLPLAARVASRR